MDGKHRHEKVFHQVRGIEAGRNSKESVQEVIICIVAHHMICGKFGTECILVEIIPYRLYETVNINSPSPTGCLTLRIANIKGGEMGWCLCPNMPTQF
jgi:hypothetical protein